jgi:hypothetical protein
MPSAAVAALLPVSLSYSGMVHSRLFLRRRQKWGGVPGSNPAAAQPLLAAAGAGCGTRTRSCGQAGVLPAAAHAAAADASLLLLLPLLLAPVATPGA